MNSILVDGVTVTIGRSRSWPKIEHRVIRDILRELVWKVTETVLRYQNCGGLPDRYNLVSLYRITIKLVAEEICLSAEEKDIYNNLQHF